MTITKKKNFAEEVTIAADTATSLADLMKAAGHGFLKDANNDITTERSLDSFLGMAAGITPLTESMYVGHDQYVRNAAGAGPPRTYKGAAIPATEEYFPNSNSDGIIDPNAEWLYSVGSQSLRIIFHGV